MCTRDDIPHQQRGALTALLLFAAAGASCHVSHHDHEVIVLDPPLEVVPEVEVNDFEWSPQALGGVHGGMQLQVEGAITDQGWDPRDGFRLVAQEDILVEVALDAHVPGVDLDWCVWDPYINAYTVCAETPNDPETGSFLIPAGAEFHMVVSSYMGTSTYSLWLGISKAHLAETADAPEGQAGPARHDVERAYGAAKPAPILVQATTWLVPTR